MKKSKRHLLLHMLGLCLLALGLRHYGWNWDEGHLLHPDERHISMVTQALQNPKTLTGWFDTDTSTFNPYNQGIHSYVYGILPIKMVHALTVAKGEMDLQEITRIGRWLSAVWSTGTVLLIYLLALRLVSSRVALSVGALMCFTVLSVQQAHFYTVDSAGVFFSTLCLGVGLVAVKEKRSFLLLVSGACVGLAMACRLNLALLALWVTAAACALAWQKRKLSPIFYLVAGGGIALLLFRICQPNAFAATGFIPHGLNPRWLEDLKQVHMISDGSLEVPFTLQWVGKIPYLYALQQMVLWGMGLPLGLLALSGSIALLWKRRLTPGHWQFLLVLWPLLLIGYHGRIHLHTLRYFLPAYPPLIFAGALALRNLPQIKIRKLLLGAVLLSSAAYTFAFLNMYRKPHPRIEASTWLLEELKAGGRVTYEYWDDPLPLRISGMEREHQGIDFEKVDVYPRESPHKIHDILTAIDRSDYMVLSSTRAAYTLPKMPLRYPIMSAFYEQINQNPAPLGLKEVARFHRTPSLFSLHLNTLRAEEALRVYDHPLVRIYEKTPDFSAEALETTLSANIDFSSIPEVSYVNAQRGNDGWLNPDQIQKRQHGPTWFQRFSPESIGNQHPVIIWTLLLALLGPISFPYVFFLFPHLRDRGWSVSRVAGLIAVSAAAWWLASLEKRPFGPALLISAMLFGAGSAAIVSVKTEVLWLWVKRHFHRLLWNELIVWMVFAFFVATRIYQPDLWHPWAGGEKPMDAAYLNAVTLTPYFPPMNPWLSGASINYYYYGFVLFASLIRMTGISPDVAYNLALPTCAFFTAGTTLSLSTAFFPWFRSRQAWRGLTATGLLSIVLVLFAGNLGQLREFLKPGKLPFLRDIYWNISRVIQVPSGEVQPITEFPYFSFLYGDLHAHVMALPVAMLCLLSSWQLYRRFHPARVFITAGLIGTVQVINTWDFPVQTAIFIFAVFAGNFPSQNRLRYLWTRSGWCLLGLLVTKLSYAPFHFYNQGFPFHLKRWHGPSTSAYDLFLAHGLFLVPLLWGTVLLFKSDRLRAAPLKSRLLPGLLFAGCLFLMVIVELFTFQGDSGRMNMVFKFYYQLWWMLAILSAGILVAAWHKTHRNFQICCSSLLAISLLYTFTALPGKIKDRHWQTSYKGLDGLAFMNTAIHHTEAGPLPLIDDRAAINWLRMNTHPFDVIMESAGPDYYWGGRISWFSGNSTVLGWEWHMLQQRSWPGGDRAIGYRKQDIQYFYESGDVQILRTYQVQYVIVGALEQQSYGEDCRERMRQQPELKEVFTTSNMSIFEVNLASPPKGDTP
ncbi:DUF2298 domain-containing protein [Kiritimatiellota bacterium B12222]|nr:DUF2298 domain-containing protein [Kiritimatiellota bacterium B12222]